jgi:Spy/CpxP family protein refolding chaperone
MQTRIAFPLLLGALVLSAGAPPLAADDKAAAGGEDVTTHAPPGGWGPDYGMTPGMMEAMALGPGIACRGPGMMGGVWGMGPWNRAGLSADQRAQINKIRDETRRKNWEWTGRLLDEQARLRDLYDAPKQDAAALSEAYRKIGELQQRIYESSEDAYKRMDAILTTTQREKWSWRFWRRW